PTLATPELDTLSLHDALPIFGSFRYGSQVAAMAAIISRRVDSHLDRLYGKLLGPLMKIIGDRRLIIVPSGPLNYVPFHALKVDGDRKSTRLNSSHVKISYAVF